MRRISISGIVALAFTLAVMACGQERQTKEGGDGGSPVSFKNDVAPIVQKHCLPCHAEENFNPSELSLDSYNNVMAGGKHGVPVVPGKASESIIVQKIESDPPFGDQMPLARKKNPGPPNKLTPEEVETIKLWINQGAKNN